MEVIDKTDGVEAEKTGEEASFALTNKNGGFCIIPPTPKSRFEGVFFKKGDNVFKVIESIRHHKPVTKVVNQLWKASREMEGITESYCMPLHSSSLIYELNEKAEFDIVLDCKHIYDNREWGRTYELSREQGCLLIKFSKKKDERDAESEFNEEFDIYIAVYGNDMEYRAVEKWEKVFYELDKERDSKPFERHVFYACMLRCKEVVFAFSTEKKTALKKAKYIWRNRQSLKREKENHVSHIIHQKALPDTETAVAYQCSLNAIDSLLVKGQGISAGLPWFFQFWARDELISLKALINMGKFLTAKKILFKNLELISDGGKIPALDIKPNLDSADGTLWLFKRIEDFIDATEAAGKRKKYISYFEMKKLKEQVHKTISQWMKYFHHDGLIFNGPMQTWMDTDWKNDSREGARIEIQALFLAALRLLRKIDKADPFEKELAKNVRKEFFDGRILADGFRDKTIRPNVFIAAYVYPELLTKKEWIKCFEVMLPKLWLSWGGLSSIDKSSPLFTSADTGESSESYHRGDSWFWINNMAALVLHRLDKSRFSKYIKKILNASIQEMLYMGVTGYSAELSSAAELRSQGCFCQAWSSALFIELIDEMHE